MKKHEVSALIVSAAALSAILFACGSDKTSGPASSGATSSASGGATSGSASGASSGGVPTMGSSSGAASGSASSGTSGTSSGSGTGSASGTASGSTSGSTSGSSGVVDGGSSSDAPNGSAPEAGPPTEAGGGTVTCGTSPAALDVTMFGKMEQMSVAPDGTIYWSNQGPTIGRYAPPYAAADINKTWKTISGAQINGIALDPKRGVLYAGSREAADKLYEIQVATPVMMTTVTLPGARDINGVTIAKDSNVYYTDQNAGNVYRIGPTETAPTKVNTMPVAQANDLAFGPDGLLYVNIWMPTPATIMRLNVQTGVPEIFVTLTGASNGDGIAFDSAGNLYANAGGLFMVTPTKTVTKIAATGSAGIEFGCGAISCNELFYATPSGVMKMTATNPGLDVFWHEH
jgi:hypothetical protein